MTEPLTLLWGEETHPRSDLLPADCLVPLHAWVEQLTCLFHLVCP